MKFIGIFVMTTQLLVAIDGQSSEGSFANSQAGASALIEYIEQNMEPAPDGTLVLAGWLDDSAPPEAIIDRLHDLDIAYSLVLPEEIREASSDLTSHSGGGVIAAFKSRRKRTLGVE